MCRNTLHTWNRTALTNVSVHFWLQVSIKLISVIDVGVVVHFSTPDDQYNNPKISFTILVFWMVNKNGHFIDFSKVKQHIGNTERKHSTPLSENPVRLLQLSVILNETQHSDRFINFSAISIKSSHRYRSHLYDSLVD